MTYVFVFSIINYHTRSYSIVRIYKPMFLMLTWSAAARHSPIFRLIWLLRIKLCIWYLTTSNTVLLLKKDINWVHGSMLSRCKILIREIWLLKETYPKIYWKDLLFLIMSLWTISSQRLIFLSTLPIEQIPKRVNRSGYPLAIVAFFLSFEFKYRWQKRILLFW